VEDAAIVGSLSDCVPKRRAGTARLKPAIDNALLQRRSWLYGCEFELFARATRVFLFAHCAFASRFLPAFPLS